MIQRRIAFHRGFDVDLQIFFDAFLPDEIRKTLRTQRHFERVFIGQGGGVSGALGHDFNPCTSSRGGQHPAQSGGPLPLAAELRPRALNGLQRGIGRNFLKLADHFDCRVGVLIQPRRNGGTFFCRVTWLIAIAGHCFDGRLMNQNFAECENDFFRRVLTHALDPFQAGEITEANRLLNILDASAREHRQASLGPTPLTVISCRKNSRSGRWQSRIRCAHRQ